MVAGFVLMCSTSFVGEKESSPILKDEAGLDISFKTQDVNRLFHPSCPSLETT
jgi:hypothetical protein